MGIAEIVFLMIIFSCLIGIGGLMVVSYLETNVTNRDRRRQSSSRCDKRFKPYRISELND